MLRDVSGKQATKLLVRTTHLLKLSLARTIVDHGCDLMLATLLMKLLLHMLSIVIVIGILRPHAINHTRALSRLLMVIQVT